MSEGNFTHLTAMLATGIGVCNNCRMARFVLISAPYHMGVEEAGVGRGPARFLAAGAAQALGIASGEVLRIRPEEATALDVSRHIRRAVHDALAAQACPVVLAGNCNSALGILAGMEAARPGIVWLDAHGDFNTPHTSLSGSLDGMALAAAVGHCYADLCEAIGLRAPVAEENVVLAGWRDLDPAERIRLTESRIAARDARSLDQIPPLLTDLRERVNAVYLHIDVDFLDPEESPGVNFRGPGGVPVERAGRLLAAIVRAVPVRAVGLANHNPEHDPDGRTAKAGVGLLRAIAAAYPSLSPP